VLVDRDGVAALSMRKLGAVLGVEAMTLYHYVPNKAALLEGLVDRILGLAVEAMPVPERGLWQEWVRGFAESLRLTLIRHPGVLPLVATRPLNSPESLRMLEGWLGELRRGGLPLGRAVDVLNVVATFTIGHTLAEAGTTPGESQDAPDLDDHEWDAAEFPNLSEVVATRAGLDFETRFTEAIEILVAGYAPP